MSEHDIDSQLKEKLDLLRPVPERSSEARVRSRTRFDADLDVFFPVGIPHRGALKPAEKTPATRPAAVFDRPRPWYYRPAFAYLAIALLLVIALFSGGAITVLASGSALPGDALYPLKLDVEQARIAMTANPEQQAELHLEFAQNRLAELDALAALGQYDRVASLAGQVNQQLTLAVAAAKRLSERDPVLALRLQSQAQQALSLFKENVGAVIIQAPPSLQPALQRALDQALEGKPPAADPIATEDPGGNNNSNGSPIGNPNGHGNAGSASTNSSSPNNQNPGASANANTNSNSNPMATPFVNANGNISGTPVPSINNNSKDNPNANPNSNKDKDKKDKDKDKNNNGQDKDKDNNSQEKDNNGRNDSSEQP